MSPVAQNQGDKLILAELNTERLRMVFWTAELAEAVLHIPSQLQDLLGVTLADGFPSPPVRNFVLPATLVHVRRNSSYGLWSGMIIHKANQQVIGSMGCKSPPDDLGQVEIGYDIVPAYQGQGFATEIGHAFLNRLLEQASVTRITAECLAENFASIRVLEKLGMKRTAANRDMIYWELPM